MRTDKGMWQGLYVFTAVESDKKTQSKKVVTMFLSEFLNDLEPTLQATSKEYIHLLSHRKIHAVFYRVELKKSWKNLPDHVTEVDSGKLHQFGIPRLIDRYLEDMDKCWGVLITFSHAAL